MTKNCQCWIAARESWGRKACLPLSVIKELDFWLKNLSKIERIPFQKILSEASVIIYSDASASGAGAFILDKPGTELVEYWSKEEATRSSTWRELRTVTIFLEVHKDYIKGRRIKWFTDNQGVPRIIFKGSMRPDL